ncbi:MAG: N-acetylmuramoyl-L-alanine amidase [Bacteroidaceae bacterium]|nr:N-acetylmuramoyl-L-alanine amidase [Bacteroidaceae bacterium]
MTNRWMAPILKRRFILLLLMLVSLTVMAQTQYAKPKKGEGITTFLQRHGRSGQAYYKEFLELNKQKLKGKTTLLLDVSYALPAIKPTGQQRSKAQNAPASASQEPKQSATGKSSQQPKDNKAQERKHEVGYEFNEPLFGKSSEKGKVESSKLKGTCIYVVSGHGGPDPGAIGKVGKTELHEDEYAYDVALRLARCLMQEGAEVHMIIQDAKDGIRDDQYLSNSKRETCMGKTIPLNQVARLQQRCDAINNLYKKEKDEYAYCRAIFLHVDSRSVGEQTDVFFYHREGWSKGQQLATQLRRTFQAKYDKHQPNRGFEGTVSTRGLYVLTHTQPVSVFVELGNIQNSHDQKRFVLSSNRQALANWITEGFINDFNR